MMTKLTVQIAFYRTLYSQSAASVTAGCVAGALDRAGHTVVTTLLRKGAHDNARALLADRTSQETVLLVKPNFQDVGESLAMLDLLRSEGEYAGLYLFGVFATLNARELLERFLHVDGVIVGEPELAAVALCDRLGATGTTAVAGLPGLLVRGLDGEIVDGGPAPVPSLVDYVRPRRDIERRERAALANLEASRGCIAACTFCHIPVFESVSSAPRRRLRPVADVVDEMIHLRRDLGKRYLIFNDGLFWSGPRDDERLDELVRLLREHPDWDGEFMVYLRTNPMLSPAQLRDLASVGLIRVFIGVESEDEATLKVYRKGARGDAYDAVKAQLSAAGVSHHIGFLMFHPVVRLEQVRRDLRFLARHDQLHRLGVIIEPARLVPGSALKQQAEEGGLLGSRDARTVDQAYSYRFMDPRVQWVFEEVRRGVRDGLGGRHRALEYFHTSSEFLEYLLRRRLGDDDPLASRPPGLLKVRAELCDQLTGYLSALVDLAEGADRDAAGASARAAELHAGAATGLRESLALTEAQHAIWFDRVAARGHGDLVQALFTSEEGA